MSTISEVHLIEVQKEIPPGGSAWAREVTRKLAIDIAEKVDPLKYNMRKIQPKDNLLPIVIGLSRGTLLPGERTLEQLPVTYLGDSETIRKEKALNPNFKVISANLIEVGQIVFLTKDHSHVFIADRVEQILAAVK
ncbi:MAG TPA: hypothetical protein VMR37_02225 [Rhabdochlamydiaceae bacterium]|jgi:hypothetical protein|nr:hypothetical protein [Rhabdochlamydiaceae bacterium]